jgi:hypothetical protein
LQKLCNLRTGESSLQYPTGCCFQAAVARLTGKTVDNIISMQKDGLAQMLENKESGFLNHEVQERLDGLRIHRRTRSSTRARYTNWSNDMDITAIGHELNGAIVVVSQTHGIVIYLPTYRIYPLASTPSSANDLPCLVIVHLGGCHYEPAFRNDWGRRHVHSLDDIKVRDLTIPPLPALKRKRERECKLGRSCILLNASPGSSANDPAYLDID